MLDCIVEIKAPFNPAAATKEMAAVLKSYRLSDTIGDRYAAEWVVDAFAKHGIKYENSERDRSAIYLDALPMFTSGRVRLLDNRRLVSQFAALERRTAPGGRDRVDHGPSGRDDICNAAALAIVRAGEQPIVINPLVRQQIRRDATLAQNLRAAGIDPVAYFRAHPRPVLRHLPETNNY